MSVSGTIHEQQSKYTYWCVDAIWAPLSEFVSSSIPSWQILTAHSQPFRGAMDLAFCLKVLLDSLLVWASSGGSGETARMLRLSWTFAARIGDKHQIRLTRPMCITDGQWAIVGTCNLRFAFLIWLTKALHDYYLSSAKRLSKKKLLTNIF